MAPVVCMITDRHRFGGDWERPLMARVWAAARAGVHLVQVRERDLHAAPLTRLVRACLASVEGTRTRVIVNDRLDVALAVGAHGVHLRGDSVPAERVRRLAGRPFLIGRSVHGLEEILGIADPGALDYLMFGTVFDSTSKPGATAAGLRCLASVVAATRVPVLAVGGLTAERFAGVAAAGAAGGAAIGLFAEAVDQPLAEMMQWLVKSTETS